MRLRGWARRLAGTGALAAVCCAPRVAALDSKTPLTGADLLARPAGWTTSAEGRRLLANVLGYQTPEGGWCKAFDARAPRDPAAGKEGYGGAHGVPIIDNGATYGEIRLLVRAFAADPQPAYRAAAVRGIEFLLGRQYASGGWPQRSPLDLGGDKNYGTHITFNDGAMIGVLELLRDVAGVPRPEFAIFDADLRRRAHAAVERGVDCILRCQVSVHGQLAVWCQQHDEVTLAPVGARSYELPSLSGAESAGIALFLLQQPRPDARVRRAITAAAQWFERAQIRGIRVQRVKGATPEESDAVVVADATAPPLWARYYDLETGRPYFADRTGKKFATLAEIPRERRYGYRWYGDWGAPVLEAYARWKMRE